MMKNLIQNEISRRAFVKYAGLTAVGLGWGFADFPGLKKTQFLNEQNDLRIGRVLLERTFTYREPHSGSPTVESYQFNDLVEIEESVIGFSESGQKNLWFLTSEADFIPASSIQIVENRLNEPKRAINSAGELGEITVPFTTAFYNGDDENKQDQQFYYGSTHWIYSLGEHRINKNLFYLIKEDHWNDPYYVSAEHVHIFSEDELQPISVNETVKQKRIKIDLKNQYLIAYEDDEPVLLSGLSSGYRTAEKDLRTPKGKFLINYKRPSRHMRHTDLFGSNDGELYGVPWVTYFADTGVAFHGTYWHNDFTSPHSHGCINLPISIAKWIYLWTEPAIAPRAKKITSQYGTPVEVI